MEVSYTLWSLQDIIKAIPFDKPAGEAFHLNFVNMDIPGFIKYGFKITVFYVDDTFPVNASCTIFSPQNIVTIIIIIKKKFEDALHAWQENGNASGFFLCCRRRELYCHEISHLIAIIRAYPSDRLSKVRRDFVKKIKNKFEASIHADESSIAFNLTSEERPGYSPSVFEKDHFRYEDDDLNYFRLYSVLMLDYDLLRNALKHIYDTKKPINFQELVNEISKETLVPSNFFKIFPERKADIRKILEKGFK